MAEQAQQPQSEEQPAEHVDALRAQLKQLNDEHLRTLADVQNAKKRLQREKDEFARYAAETVIRELLPIVDSLDQALVAVDKQAESNAVITGVHLIHRQLLGLLQKEGVARIPTVGEPFDPHKHEAVAQIDVDDEELDGTVIEEVQVGYMMHGQVLRPAMVKVGKSAAHSRQHTADSAEQPPEQEPGKEKA